MILKVSIQSSVAVDYNHAKKLGAEDSVDSLSRTDSLEGNCGSISVLSTQSDTPAVVDSEKLPSTDNPASKEGEETNSKKPEGVTERQLSEKSDVFDAPSFMTLVEPGGGVHHKGSGSAIQITQNPQQQKVLSSEAGWFPSLTNVVNESQGKEE
ncbi:hypothetical protein Patl1_23639 [Pistacia atlantica]|uniref:Uncharacterized protein n=1 Tax=Pistacia atlantica TaxID=434234 RepID=A0ACC1A0I5_9ROSI|nr:hypothetical protein Patl1_23639 [Pistacia atlantica]